MNDDHVIGPDFLCIGARKTGTTWLYAFLKKHPECRMTRLKEINFFNSVLFNAAPGTVPEPALAAKWQEIRKKKHLPEEAPIPEEWRKNPVRWYVRSFKRPQGMVSGDVSPLYQSIPAARIPAIHQAIPAAKIIYILRHPLERVLSDFSMMTNNRNIDVAGLTDAECLKLLKEHYADNIRYAQIYRQWSAHFPTSVFWYEELRRDPVTFAAQICNLLGIAEMPELARETSNPNPSTSYGPRPTLSAAVQLSLAQMLLPEAEATHQLFANDLTAAWVDDIRKKTEAR